MSSRHKNLYLAIFLAIVSVAIASILFYSRDDGVSYCNLKQYFYDTKTFHVVNNSCPSIGEIFESYFVSTQTDLKKMQINISNKNFRILKEDINKARSRGRKFQSSWANASIIFNKKRYKAKIKLHGLLKDHWSEDYRFSFKVKLKGGKRLLGLKSFIVMKPWSRLFEYYGAYGELNNKLGVKYAKYTPLNVHVNDLNWGLMILEPKIDRFWLEQSGYASSSVAFLNNWRGRYFSQVASTDGLFDYPNIILEEEKSSDEINKDFVHAIFSAEQAKGSVDLINYLDINNFAAAAVAAFYYGNFHALHLNNALLYFNPITRLIEVIPGDQSHPAGINSSFESDRDYLKYIGTFSEPLRSYIFYLHLKELPIFWEYVELNIRKIEEELGKIDALDVQNFSQNCLEFHDCRNNMYTNKFWPNLSVNSIKEKMLGMEENFSFNKDESQGTCSKDQSSISPGHVVALTGFSNGEAEFTNFSSGELDVQIIIQPFSSKGDHNQFVSDITLSPKEVRKISVNYIPINALAKVKISSHTQGECRRVLDVIASNYSNVGRHVTFFDEKADIAGQKQDMEGNFIISGRKVVDRLIYVGPNSKLVINPGSVLEMREGGTIYIDGGTVQMLGTVKSPIVIRGNGKGTIFVKDSPNVSLSHLIIDNLTNCCGENKWTTGSFTLYRSKANFKDVVFLSNDTEDTLHVAESELKADTLSFNNGYSDGLDADNSLLDLTRIYAKNIKGDAIDLFSSRAHIEYFDIRNIRDKGFSIGEKSQITIRGGVVKDVSVAFASKDGSSMVLDRVLCENVDYACVLSYKKKRGYNASRVDILNSSFEGPLFYTKHGSINGVKDAVKVDERDIGKLYQSGFMKKIK